MLNLDRHQSSQLALKTQIYLFTSSLKNSIEISVLSLGPMPLAWLRQKTGIVPTTAGVLVILLHAAHMCSPVSCMLADASLANLPPVINY